MTNMSQENVDVEHDSDLEKTIQAFSAAVKSAKSNRPTNVSKHILG